MYVDSTKLINYNYSGLLGETGVIWEYNSYILRMMTQNCPNAPSFLLQRKGATVFWALGLNPLPDLFFFHLEEMTQITIIPWLFVTLT